VAGSTPSRSVRRHHHPGRPAVSDAGRDAAAAGQLDSRHLPALNPAQLPGVESAVSVGLAPVPPRTPPRVASVITEISHHAFVSGMHAAFLVAAVVALASAAIALITKGERRGGAHA
jgi:hypothetical protein